MRLRTDRGRPQTVALAALAMWVTAAASASAATFTVNTNADTLGLGAGNGRCETAPGNGVCTFRRAMYETSRLFSLAAGSSSSASVTILLNVPGGVLTLAPGTWTLANALVSGPGQLSIVGAGPTATTINATGATPASSTTPLFLLNVDAVQMSGFTVLGAGLPIQYLRDTGSLRLEHVRFQNSVWWAVQFGGAQGWIIECEFSGNRWGGVFMAHTTQAPGSGLLRIERTVMRDNLQIGAIQAVSGTIELDGVTFIGNQASTSGGAISLLGDSALRATNTTFSGNSANGSGGAVYVDSGLTGSAQVAFAHVTFAANVADADRSGNGVGGALAVTAATPNRVSLAASLLSGNVINATGGATSSACAGAVTVTSATLFDTVNCTVTGSTVTEAASLEALQDNGGRTPTHALLSGSVAINQVAAPCRNASGGTLVRDQRGHARPAGAQCDLGAVESGAVAIPKAVRYDFNGDGKSDLLWRYAPTGLTSAWLMNGSTISSIGAWSPGDANWKPLASDDFDGDGKSDLAWWHMQYGLAIWLMDGANPTVGRLALSLVDPPSIDRRLAGTGDVDGDGRADLVFELYSAATGLSSGQTEIWLMDGTSLKGIRPQALVPGWRVVGVGDADGDGTSDLLWRNETTGGMSLWFMVNGSIASIALLPTVSEPGWVVAGFADVDADDRADVIWRHLALPSRSPVQGATAIWLVHGPVVVRAEYVANAIGEEWALAQVLDTDGDQRADIIWRGATGLNARWSMDGVTVLASEFLPPVSDLGWQIR